MTTYYQFDVRETEGGVITFVHPKSLEPINSDRFKVDIALPNKNKLYFLPQHRWDSIEKGALSPSLGIPVELLSGIKHGMPAHGYNYTKSPYYRSPFSIVFKNNPLNVGANYLLFNDFLIPNSYTLSLGILSYDDDQDKFLTVLNTQVVLPFQHFLTLTPMLEFVIKDANQKVLDVMDGSLIIIEMNIL